MLLLCETLALRRLQ